MKSFSVPFSIVLLFLAVHAAVSADLAGKHPADTLELGKRMYREGVLPNGEPMQALVMGDVPFDGRMFTCCNCHQRSGLGSAEGRVITWPINSKALFSPRSRTGAFRPSHNPEKGNRDRQQLPEYYRVPDVRPAYTNETLARVIRTGIDAAGNHLSGVMPRYRLDESNMAILINYLQHLSSSLSPGVDNTTIHFATIIGGNVSSREKESMLSVLQAHFESHNSQSRNEEKRAVAGPFFRSESNQAYRRLQLHVWELHGPDTTWRKQLESYNRNRSVFAIIGGISNGNWEVIHSFCEQENIPCLFPITDLPKLSDSDWYTLYFSRGHYQEAESAARYLQKKIAVSSSPQIIQLYDPQDIHSTALAKAFSATWQSLGGKAPQDLVINEKNKLTNKQLDKLFQVATPTVLMLWIDGRQRDLYRRLAASMSQSTLCIGSATLLHQDFSAIPDAVREKMYFTYPYSTPQEDANSRTVVKAWLKVHHIPELDFNIQAKMYFVGWMLPGALKAMRSEFFRDYFMEGFDMMTDQSYAIAVYPRLSFGPGQRYAAKKGCYLVRVASGENHIITPVSDWIIY